VNPRRDRNGPYPSNDGYTYRGRGIVQVTGRGNYAKIDAMFGTDTVDNPDTMATNSQLLANVIVWGMTGGNFTGASLNQYVNSSQQDYYNARRTVNGIFPNDAASKAEASTVQTYSQKYAPIVDANC
jgi:predicted chitinase